MSFLLTPLLLLTILTLPNPKSRELSRAETVREKNG
jgi:hypothetical protein